MPSDSPNNLIFPPFRLETAVDVLFAGEEIVALEPKAARVLRVLVENAPRIVTKEELLETVWADVFTTDDVLKKAVSQIRRALLSADGNRHEIETHHRRGYQFVFRAPETTASETKVAETPPSNAALDPNFNLFIGRENELELLQREFRRAQNGIGQPVLVVGDPGIGKTQLATRFERWATNGEKAICVRVRFFDYEAARLSSFALFFDLLKESLLKSGGADDLTGAVRDDDFYCALAAQNGVVLPSNFFSNPGASFQVQSDIFRVIEPLAKCLTAISRRAPLVLMFDDLQWADDASRKFVGYLMRVAATEKLLVLGLSRRAEIADANGDFARWLDAQAVYRSFTTINLSPLSAADFRNFIDEVFQRQLDAAAIPNQDFNAIYQTTGGNPYFLIEILRLLIAENKIERDGAARWLWRGLRDVPLPETIRLAARHKLSGLSPQTRDLVERAAVIGDAFQLETLEKMYGETIDENDLENCLTEAVNAEVLTERDVVGANDCQFYHTILRRAVYADLSPRRRKRLHAHAAKAIEAKYADSLERVAAPLSAHLEAAENHRATFERALQAGCAASRRFDWAEASELITRANRAAEKLNLTVETAISDAENLQLLLADGEITMSMGRRAEAEILLEKAAQTAARLNDDAALAAARVLQGQTRILTGHYRAALESLDEGRALAEKIGCRDLTAHALTQIASAQYTLGEFAAALENLQKVVDDPHSNDYFKAVALGKIGWVYGLQSEYETAKNCLTRAAEFHRTAGDVRQRIVLQMCLNWCENGLGNYESAIACAENAAREARNLGEPYSVVVAAMRVGKSRLTQGCYDEAESLFNSVLSKINELGGVHCEAETIWFLGRLKMRTGDLPKAAELLNSALEKIKKIGDREDEFRVLIDLSELKLLENNVEDALDIAAAAVQIAEDLKIPDGIGAAFTTQARALFAASQTTKAKIAATRAINLLETVKSGELWTAYDALATIEDQSNAPNALENRRKSVALLTQIHSQFAALDTERRRNFIVAHQKPADELFKLLNKFDCQDEAEQISRFWQLI